MRLNCAYFSETEEKQYFGTVQIACFGVAEIVKFVHTYPGGRGIIIPVKTPNTLYNFCYTP